MLVIKTVEDAKRFLNNMLEAQITDFRFLNETHFVTKYYTRDDKPGVFRKKFIGTDGECIITKKVKPELVLEDAKFINEELKERQKYWTDLGLIK